MRRSKNPGSSPVVFGCNVEIKHRKNYTVGRPCLDLYRQKPAYPETGQVHPQAEQEGFSKTETIGTNEIQQAAFENPNQELGNDQSDQILAKEKIYYNPQQRLGKEIDTNAREQKGLERSFSPDTVAGNNCPFEYECNEQSKDQAVLERRIRKTANPATNPIPIRAQQPARITIPVRGKPPRLNCASTSKSSGRIVTV